MAKGVRVNKVSTLDFCAKYPALARAGKSALEIGQAFGLKGTDQQIASFVSIKATNLRKRLTENAEAKAKELGLDEVKTAELVKMSAAKVPGIKSHSRVNKTAEIMSALDAALAALDAE